MNCLTRAPFELQIKNYEKTECLDERRKLAKEVYDNFIMKEMLSHTHVSDRNGVYRPAIVASPMTTTRDDDA